MLCSILPGLCSFLPGLCSHPAWAVPIPAWAEPVFHPVQAVLIPARAGGQGHSDASRDRFRRADGAQLRCPCVSIPVRPVYLAAVPPEEEQSRAPSGDRPGSVPTSSGLAVTGFLCCASAEGRGEADAESAHWQPRSEGADPCFVPWPCLPSLPWPEDAVPGPCVPQCRARHRAGLQPQAEQLEFNHSSYP